MKVAVAFCFLAFVAISSQDQKYEDLQKVWTAEMAQHKQACLEESHVEEGILKRVTEHGDFVDDRALKCFSKCIHRKLNIINDFGEVNEEGFKLVLKLEDEDLADRVVQECKSVEGDDLCEKSFARGKCIYKVVTEGLKKND